MGFKKYVPSRNLFDVNRLPSDTWTTDTRYYMNGGIATSKTVDPTAVTISMNNNTLSVTTTGGNGAGFLVEVKPSTIYRLIFSKSESLASNKTSCAYTFLDTYRTIGQTQLIYGDTDGVVFTTNSDTKYVYFVFRKAAGTISYSNIMLSEGQTALPYEPYGGTWQPIIPKKLKGIPYTGTLPATLTGTKAGYLHSYKIYGNTEQTGTPTPENPIVPSECGERTENLIGALETGGINIDDGTPIANPNQKRTKNYESIISGASYTIINADGRVRVYYYANDFSFISSTLYSNETFTVSEPDASYFKLAAANISWAANIMLVKGSTAPSDYIPYGYKLPLQSGSTPVDIYIGESQTTRRIKKLVLTGNENWQTSTTGASTRIFTVLSNCMSLSPAVCTDFKYNPAIVGYPRVNEFVINSTSSLIFGISLDDFADLNAWKSYLATQYANGTPVTVWYVLATPTTGTLNEPLRKIGDYADTIDSTQTTTQIPTSADSTTISWAGEGLAPSQFDSIAEWVDAQTYTYTNGAWVADN